MARLSEEEYRLNEWLAAGFQADMSYMERNIEMRRDPAILLQGARSVVSLLLSYKPDRLIEGDIRIAQYAYDEDYHEKLKRMQYQLISIIKQRYDGFDARPFVDTAPISDKNWAVRAGLGWQGKNTLLVNEKLGSFCFLGELVTTAEVDIYDSPNENGSDRCGECKRCVDACPNKAIVFLAQSRSYHIDASKCTSYNTVENRTEELPDSLDTRGFAFGCDICQQVCPYNVTAPWAYALSDERKKELESLPCADEETFRRITKHSAMNRIKYSQWRRNIAFCLSKKQ